MKKFKINTSGLKYKLAGFLVGAGLAPLSILLAGKSYDVPAKQIFECAYKWNVPESHKTYTYYSDADWPQAYKLWYELEDPDYYSTPSYPKKGTLPFSPFITYPFILMFGCAGAFGGTVLNDEIEERKAKRLTKQKENQH